MPVTTVAPRTPATGLSASGVVLSGTVAPGTVAPETVEPEVDEPPFDQPVPDEVDPDKEVVPDTPWLVIVWNDPVNLMSYVVWVLRKLFGYSKDKATRLMMDVHTKGKAVVSHGTREKAEADVARLHAHGLWATMQRDT